MLGSVGVSANGLMRGPSLLTRSIFPSHSSTPSNRLMAEPLGKLYFLFDRDHGPRDRLIPRWLFLRALGLVYFSAFLALYFQILGMSGSGGVLPAATYLTALRPLGNQRLWFAPTLFWFGSSDHALTLLVWAGLLASVLVTFNLVPRPALLVC